MFQVIKYDFLILERHFLLSSRSLCLLTYSLNHGDRLFKTLCYILNLRFHFPDLDSILYSLSSATKLSLIRPQFRTSNFEYLISNIHSSHSHPPKGAFGPRCKKIIASLLFNSHHQNIKFLILRTNNYETINQYSKYNSDTVSCSNPRIVRSGWD